MWLAGVNMVLDMVNFRGECVGIVFGAAARGFGPKIVRLMRWTMLVLSCFCSCFVQNGNVKDEGREGGCHCFFSFSL